MAKRISIYLLFFVVAIAVLRFGIPDFPSQQKESEHYGHKAIHLGRYDVKAGSPISGRDGVNWWKVESFQIAIDELRRIYVLDIYRSRILQHSPAGALLKEIFLKDTRFPYTNPDIDDGYIAYTIEVSGDGRQFSVRTDEDIWTLFNDSGEVVRQEQEGQVSLLSQRECKVSKRDRLSYRHGYFIRRPYVTKTDAAGTKLWEKKVEGQRIVYRIIGTDGNGNIYLLADQPKAIVKLDKDGRFLSRIELPEEAASFMRNGAARGAYHLLCDGALYYIPPMLFKHDEGYQDFLSQGVRNVYMLERLQ